MTYSNSGRAWTNLAGSAAIVVVMATVGTAQARQDQSRNGEIKGSVTQKGRADQAAAVGSAISGTTGGAGASIVVARPEDQTACDSGVAAACRTIEAQLQTGGAWAFQDGGTEAMDDWETQSARKSFPMKMQPPAATERSSGNHIPSAVIVHRALAACDSGDVTACHAFARAVRPATAAERTETRTYTAGR